MLTVRELALEQINSRPNARRASSKAADEGLDLSIRAHGIVTPILVRSREIDSGFDLVAGERRLQAARRLKLETIPAAVLELDDQEADGVHLVENLQRVDLTPLEEARAFARMRHDHDATAEQIADAIGKRAAYVADRLSLLRLPKGAAEALEDGRLSFGIALLLAQIQDDETLSSASEAILTRLDLGPLTVQDARDVLEAILLDLGSAPWDLADQALLPAAGACSNCPKNTGNQRDLFPTSKVGRRTVEPPDRCLDRACYRSKLEATWEAIQAQALLSAGDLVAVEGRAASSYITGRGEPLDGFVNLRAKCPEDPKTRTWEAIAKGRPFHVYAVRDRRGGIHRIGDRVELLRAAQAKGSDWATAALERRKPREDDSKARAEKEAKRRAFWTSVHVKASTLAGEAARAAGAQVLEKIPGSRALFDVVLASLKFSALATSDGFYLERLGELCSRLGRKVGKAGPFETLVAYAEAFQPRQLPELLELAVQIHAAGVTVAPNGIPAEAKEALVRLGVDLEAVATEVRTTQAEAAAPKVEPEKKPTKLRKAAKGRKPRKPRTAPKS